MKKYEKKKKLLSRKISFIDTNHMLEYVLGNSVDHDRYLLKDTYDFCNNTF